MKMTTLQFLTFSLILILVFGSLLFSLKPVRAAKEDNTTAPSFDPWEWVKENAKSVIDFIATNVMGLKSFIEYVWSKYIYTPVKNAIDWVFRTALKNITSGINAITSGISKFVEDFQVWIGEVRESLVNAAKGFIEMLQKMLGLEVVWCAVQ